MRLESYLEGNQLLCEEQNGFRKRRSCIDNIMMLTMIGRKIIKRKGSMFGGFIDLKKAYDSVDRCALWNRLKSLGIGGKIFDSIKAIYSDLKCKVKVGDKCSDSFPVDVGLRQGCVLSPILFSAYVNDLMEELRREHVGIEVEDIQIPGLMFADDIVVFAESEVQLNRALEVVNKWCCKWKMKINVGKSGVIHFRDKRRIKRCKEVFRIGGEVIQMVAEYKYLGVIIDESLKGDRMMESVMENGRKALYGVNRLIRGLGNVGWETFTKLYMSYVRSSMLYAAEIWGLLCRNEYKLEKVQRSAIRSRLGVHSKFPLLGLELEAGWMPVRWEAKIRAIKYYIKASRNEKMRLLNRVMVWANEGVGWMEGEEGFLECIGWNGHGSPGEMFADLSLDQVNEMLEACVWRKLQEEWREGCSRSQKLRYWEVLVGDIAFAEWKMGGAVRVQSKDQRKLIGELRCGCAKLEVETGRWREVAREDRICLLCKKEMGDERHFLTSCEALQDERCDLEQLMKKEDDKLNDVMKRLHEKTISRIVMRMWNRRIELL